MSFEPTNEQLIDFVYGNLPEPERLQVERAIHQDVFIKERVGALNSSRSFLHNLEDEEVLGPEGFVWKMTKNKPKQRILWSIIAVAASLTLLLLVAFATKLEVRVGSFELAFGHTPEVKQNALTNAQIQDLIDKSILSNNIQITAQLEDVKSEFRAQLAANTKLQLNDMHRIAVNAKELPKKQVDKYLAQLSDSNRAMVAEFFAVSAMEQEEYMNAILMDFFEFMDEKSKDDIRVLQASIEDVEFKSEQKIQQTDLILSSILTSVNTSSMGL